MKHFSCVTKYFTRKSISNSKKKIMKLEEKKVSILSLKCTENNAPAAS